MRSIMAVSTCTFRMCSSAFFSSSTFPIRSWSNSSANLGRYTFVSPWLVPAWLGCFSSDTFTSSTSTSMRCTYSSALHLSCGSWFGSPSTTRCLGRPLFPARPPRPPRWFALASPSLFLLARGSPDGSMSRAHARDACVASKPFVVEARGMEAKWDPPQRPEPHWDGEKGCRIPLWPFLLHGRRRVRARDPSGVRTRRPTRACSF
mmetsp:Transcript_4918/g.31459  ORF Transcript_4918/g.31459 Transcript_4918/m.31459 type:complete len:205 (+) Transcript_4918:3055-3669(+)